MKTKSFFAIAILLSSNLILSQEDPEKILLKKSDYWNISLSGGVTGNLKTNGFNKNFDEGINYSVDVSYTPENNIGFFTNYTGTVFNTNNPPSVKYYSLTAGPRIYSNNKKLFSDIGIGYYRTSIYDFNSHSYYSYFPNRNTVGINLGFGGKINFNDSYAAIFTGRIHNTFVNGKQYIYFGLNAGLELNYNKSIPSDEHKKENSFAAGLFAGVSKSNYLKASNAYGMELTYDLKDRLSLVGNFLYQKSSQSTFYAGYSRELSSFQELDVTIGPRFYIVKQDFRLFVESLAGAYWSKNESIFENYYITYSIGTYRSNVHAGVQIGTGTEFKIVNGISGLFKANVDLLVGSRSHSGLYGGLKFRF